MLTIHVPETELFDEKDQSFLLIPEMDLRMEHSLISLSKWEGKWKKPYLTQEEKTREEMLDYFACMCVDKTIDRTLLEHLSLEKFREIMAYIGDPHTATKIYDLRQNRGGKPDIMTSEMIYYYMIHFGIPFECQKWHLNRLLTLIKVCSFKTGGAGQMSMDEVFAFNKGLNAKRRAAMNG